MLLSCVVEFDRDKDGIRDKVSVSINPHAGVTIKGAPNLYPSELEILSEIINVLKSHKDKCFKP